MDMIAPTGVLLFIEAPLSRLLLKNSCRVYSKVAFCQLCLRSLPTASLCHLTNACRASTNSSNSSVSTCARVCDTVALQRNKCREKVTMITAVSATESSPACCWGRGFQMCPKCNGSRSTREQHDDSSTFAPSS